MTIWMAVSFWLGMVAYPVAWLCGGHAERFAAAVMLAVCVIITLNFFLPLDVGDRHLPGRIADCVRLLIFGWLCFRSDRWWPFLTTATLGLMVVADVVGWLGPGVSQWGVSSAKIGLGYLADLSLLLGVWEHRLAGEEPAGRAAWARASMATIARRDRKKPDRRSSAPPPHEPSKAWIT
jgi:hypothetical protein